MIPSIASRYPFLDHLSAWSERVRLARKAALALTALSVIAGVMTAASMSGTWSEQGRPDPDVVVKLLYLDIILFLSLAAFVAWRVVALFVERRRRQAGSGLLSRMVTLFSLVAVTPAIIVAVFAAIFLNLGIQTWFSDRVQTAIKESNAVAMAYLAESQKSIRADALSMANDLNREAPNLARNQALFNRALTNLAAVRSLSEAVVMDSNGRIVARSGLSLSLEFGLIPRENFEAADTGQIVTVITDGDDRVRALLKLNRFVDTFLLVGRFVEPSVLEHIDKTAGAVRQYKLLEERQGNIQITFVIMFGVVALLLLTAAVWVGIAYASRMVEPIQNLIAASEGVRKGDLSVRVDEEETDDELETLSRAFNKMADQIEVQQDGLMEANRELDERHRFTEIVLEGVSAGVIGLDEYGRINLPNRSASVLLGTNLSSVIGRHLKEVVPEMGDLITEVITDPERAQQGGVSLVRSGKQKNLLVTAACERIGGKVVGYVVTFDDVTDLLSAQRKAAWSDVARRIAHEIKNPLTPIQLSAERLKRKYLSQITEAPETFITCTDTIIRQVEEIGRMVNEFSSFARMPQAVFKEEDIAAICRQTVFLERNRHPDVHFEEDYSIESGRILSCDSQLVAQALTNILKNASESVEARLAQKTDVSGEIYFSLFEEAEGGVRITVEDNGIGLPVDKISQLTEPYVTTRTKGTGLGLAIVKKIMEDHGGDLILENKDDGGAKISMIFRDHDSSETKKHKAG